MKARGCDPTVLRGNIYWEPTIGNDKSRNRGLQANVHVRRIPLDVAKKWSILVLASFGAVQW